MAPSSSNYVPVYMIYLYRYIFNPYHLATFTSSCLLIIASVVHIFHYNLIYFSGLCKGPSEDHFYTVNNPSAQGKIYKDLN